MCFPDLHAPLRYSEESVISVELIDSAYVIFIGPGPSGTSSDRHQHKMASPSGAIPLSFSVGQQTYLQPLWRRAE